MQTMNISLPDPLKQFVDGLVAQGRYRSASEYVLDLIQADGKRGAELQLEGLLLDGLEGEDCEMTPMDWANIKDEALAALKAGNTPRR